MSVLFLTFEAFGSVVRMVVLILFLLLRGDCGASGVSGPVGSGQARGALAGDAFGMRAGPVDAAAAGGEGARHPAGAGPGPAGGGGGGGDVGGLRGGRGGGG